MNNQKDSMGRAILEYWENKMTDKLIVFSPMFEEDEIPVEVLFRKYEEMPLIERKALDITRGKTLDVGAGSGCHSLVLQEKGIDVTAIDISPLSVEVMKKRGVKRVYEQDFFTWEGQEIEQGESSNLLIRPSHYSVQTSQYDTILMLMNGIGIVGTLERLPEFFHRLNDLLAPGGQVLCDSTDICYIFEDINGDFDYPDSGHYYGELTYQMQYKDIIGDSFPWLYIDANTLKEKAKENGYYAEIIEKGEHYDYLARITKPY